MKNFTYSRAKDAGEAIDLFGQNTGARYLGGGTNLVDLMRETVESSDALVDVTRLSRDIEATENGGYKIGAAATNTALANHQEIRENFPLLPQAILFGASGQIRNMATVVGNLLQRTRCGYFYDTAAKCNKREPASGCDALEGFNRSHAILGWSDKCIAVMPSDMCVALAALDATVNVKGANGERSILFGEFHRLPNDTPQIENALQAGELITSIEIAPLAAAKNSLYRKVRDRASYAFALVSLAAILETENGAIKIARLALGGVAHKPWRCAKAEEYLNGKAATEENFKAAAEAELADAKGFEYNNFKIELAKRIIVGVLKELAISAGK